MFKIIGFIYLMIVILLIYLLFKFEEMEAKYKQGARETRNYKRKLQQLEEKISKQNNNVQFDSYIKNKYDN